MTMIRVAAGFASSNCLNKAIVDSAPDLEVVGESDDGATALEVIRDRRADVVLVDVRMPGRDGNARRHTARWTFRRRRVHRRFDLLEKRGVRPVALLVEQFFNQAVFYGIRFHDG